MSPTVRPPPASAEAFSEPPPLDASGACGCTTVVVLPVSIAPVPSSTATTTATTRPPKTPASRFDRPLMTGEGRESRLIRRKTGVRRDGDEAAQPRDGPAAFRERPSQRAPVAAGRRRAGTGPGVALLAQESDVVRCTGSGGHPEPPLQFRQRGARRILIAQPVEGLAKLRHRALSPARVEMRPAPDSRHQPQDGQRQRDEHEEGEPEEPPLRCRPAGVRP